MMQRNLNGRVEALVPIDDPALRDRLDEVLAVVATDDRLAWELEDTAWTKVPASTGLNSHLQFQSLALERSRGAAPDPATAQVSTDVVLAAGGIVVRASDGSQEVLLVHRPEYRDWTFPKGKLDPGEAEADAAVREVLEETGFTVELGEEIGTVEYADRNQRRKVVRYWIMRPTGGGFEVNDEVDEIRWCTPEEAVELLTYERDRAMLRSAVVR